MSSILFDDVVNGLLSSTALNDESKMYLAQTFEGAREKVSVQDWRIILPLIMAVFYLKKGKIDQSPTKLFELAMLSVEPLLPALRVMPQKPYGILDFDPWAQLVEMISKNIATMLDIKCQDILPF